jgi:hypothetical protein
LGWLIGGGVALAAVGIGVFVLLWRSPAIQKLVSLATDVSAEFRLPVNVSLTEGRYLALKIYNPPPSSDSVRPEWARSIARFALDRYATVGALDSVSVSLVNQRQQGAVTVTRERERYVWSVEQLRDSVADPEDDSFARSFLEHVRSQDAAGAAQLKPGSVISSKGWKSIAAMSSYFPKGGPLRIRPVGWLLLVDSSVVAKKLSYRIEASAGTTLAEVWLVDVGGRPYVETFRMSRITK